MKSKMTLDLEVLEQFDVSNTCIVKKLDTKTSDLYESHILFNYWVNMNSVTFKLIPTGDNYDVYYKDIKIIKNKSIDKVIPSLSRCRAKVLNQSPGKVYSPNLEFTQEE